MFEPTMYISDRILFFINNVDRSIIQAERFARNVVSSDIADSWIHQGDQIFFCGYFFNKKSLIDRHLNSIIKETLLINKVRIIN